MRAWCGVSVPRSSSTTELRTTRARRAGGVYTSPTSRVGDPGRQSPACAGAMGRWPDVTGSRLAAGPRTSAAMVTDAARPDEPGISAADASSGAITSLRRSRAAAPAPSWVRIVRVRDVSGSLHSRDMAEYPDPRQFTSIVDIIDDAAARYPASRPTLSLRTDDGIELAWSAAELRRRARLAAWRLRAAGLAAGRPAADLEPVHPTPAGRLLGRGDGRHRARAPRPADGARGAAGASPSGPAPRTWRSAPGWTRPTPTAPASRA